MAPQDPEDVVAKPDNESLEEFDRSPPNEIITLDAHIDPPEVDHPMYMPPQFDVNTMATLADATASIDGITSARLETERRAMVENEEYAPRFTAADLTEIAVHLAVTRHVCWLTDSPIEHKTFSRFRRLVKDSHDAPLSERYMGIDDERVVARNGDRVYPFQAIGNQLLFFADEKTGDLMHPQEISRYSDFPDIQYRHP